MVVLGSTGSIGVNTLNIAKRFTLPVTAICANTNVNLLNQQISIFKPKFVAIGDKSLKDQINHNNIFVGENGILEMLEIAFEADMTLVNALVGFSGLKPTCKALSLGYKLALANKESLVVAGKFFDTSKIFPIDSEHFGLWYLLQNSKKIQRMIITASGGAFRDIPINLIGCMKPENALKHPNWKMGKKITIDSATMANKLFEIIEARWLFNTSSIDAIIEKKSIIHALIDFCDGSTVAHIANADMKLPIAYALLGRVEEQILPHIDFLHVRNLEFCKIDEKRYPIWELKDILLKKPHLGVVINAANEVAVELFLKNKIIFADISKYSILAMKKFENININSLDEVFLINKEVRNFIETDL